MKSNTDHIVFFRELTSEQAEALREAIASDPDAARALWAWRHVREALGRRLEEQIGDRELFVLFVLYEYGDPTVLSESERARVEAAAPALREAVARHPGLEGIGSDIAGAAREFDAVWKQHFGADPTAPKADPWPDRTARAARSASRSRTARWSARIAIAAGVLIFGALLVVVLQRDHGMTTVETAENETRTVNLGDGSEVRLLAGSRLSYTPPADAAPLGRQLVLDGRAYFDITPTAEGFVVKTETAQLTVLGTAFGVQADRRSTEIILAEGRLTVASRRAPGQAVVLNPGQMSRVDADAPPSSPRDVAVHEQLAWTGLFVFSSTPLGEILNELSRHFNVPLSVSDPLSGERITGRFEQDQDLEEILTAIAGAVGADIQPLPSGGYRLARR